MSLAERIHVLPDLFQMSTIALMAHLYLLSEVVSHPTPFFRHGTNLLIDGHFEFTNGLWIVLIQVVFQEPPEIKIRQRVNLGESRDHLGSQIDG